MTARVESISQETERWLETMVSGEPLFGFNQLWRSGVVIVRILYLGVPLDPQNSLNLQGRSDEHGFETCKSMLGRANIHNLRVLIKAASAAGCCRRLG